MGELTSDSTMLDYAKVILQKVSFDFYLFHRELTKALEILMPREAIELLIWARYTFQNMPHLRACLD